MRDVLFYLVLTSLVVLGEGHHGDWEAHAVTGDDRYPYDSNTMSPFRFKTVSDASFSRGDEVWVTFYYGYGGYGRLKWSERNWRVELYHCTDGDRLTTSGGEEFTIVPHDSERIWEVSWTRTTYVIKCNGVKVWQYKYDKSKFSDQDCKNMYSGKRGPLTSVQFNAKSGLVSGQALNVPTEYYTKKNKDKKKKDKKKKEDEGKKGKDKKDKDKKDKDKKDRGKNEDKKKKGNWYWEAHAVTGGDVYPYYSISPIRFKTVSNTSWKRIVCVTFYYGGGGIWGQLRWFEGNWGVELYACTDADLLTTYGEGEFTNVPDGPERIWELSSTPTTYVVKCNGVKVWEYQYAKSKFSDRDCKDRYSGNSGPLASVKFNAGNTMNVPTEYYTKEHEGGKVEDKKT